MTEAQEKMKRLEGLFDDELLEKAWAELSALCGSKGRPKKWRMTVPVDADNDSDVLFGEILKRYAQLEDELKRCRKLAHSYIEAYEKLAFIDALEEGE